MKKIIIFSFIFFLLKTSLAQGEFVVEIDRTNGSYMKTGPVISGVTYVYPNERAYNQNTGSYIFPSAGPDNRLFSIDVSNGSTLSNPLISNLIKFKYHNLNNVLYGLEEDNVNFVKNLVSIDPSTGAYTQIGSSIPVSSNIQGFTTIDEINDRFIFLGPPNLLYSINTQDGSVVSNPPFLLNAGENIIHFKFDNSSGILYGVLNDNNIQQYFLVTINPTTGQIIKIGSGTTFGTGGGTATIDEGNQQYIYMYSNGSGGYDITTLNLSSGSLVSNATMQGDNLDNFFSLEFDNTTNKLYSIHWDWDIELTTNDQTEWVQTTTPPGGSVWALETIGNSIFAGTTSGGVYFSDDEGDTWTQRNGVFPDMRVYSLAVSGSDIYAGTGGGISNAAVYKSSDNGLTWTDITPSSLNSSSSVRAMAVNNTSIFIGTSGDGIYKAPLSGVGWSAFNTNIPNDNIRSLEIKGSTIYAGTYGDGVYTSLTSVDNWSLTSSTMPVYSDYIQALDVSNATIFAGNISGLPVLYSSIDNGSNWAQSNTGVFNDKPVYAINSYNNNVYVGTEGAGMLRSSDYGATWATYNEGFKDSFGNWYCNQINIRSIAFTNSNIFAGTDCGVWKRSFPVSTEVDYKNEEDLFILYPNPSSGKFNVKIEGILSNGVQLKVFNSLGKIVFISINELQLINEIDLSNFPKGIYFVKIYKENKVQIKKILLN